MSDPVVPSATPAPLPTALRAPESRTAQLLLASRLPARMAWVDRDGRPQVAPMWFEWDGAELLLSTFAGSRKLDDLADGSQLAVTIDTSEFPYRSVKMSGPITVEPSDGLTDSYRRAARRYLGEQAGSAWCDALTGQVQVLIRLRPTRASVSDMSSMPFITEPTGDR